MKVSVESLDKDAFVETDSFTVKTTKGTFTIGVTNDGDTYISTGMRPICMQPRASNRVHVWEGPE